MEQTKIKCKLTEKALKNRVINTKHIPTEGLLRIALPDYVHGEGEDILDEMCKNNMAGFEYIKGRKTVSITDVEEAVEFLECEGGNVPAGFGESDDSLRILD
jgi:hypothetical protein